MIIDYHPIFLSLLLLCFLSLLAQIAFYLLAFLRLALFKKTKGTEPLTQRPVSVIICAKDEADNLEAFLPVVCEQEYPFYEVIVVDDASIDETAEVLQHFQKQYPQLRSISTAGMHRDLQGKKFALTKGIDAARNDQILLTDADCRPKSAHWIRDMIEPLKNPKTIVLGYGAYQRQKGLLNKLIRYETLMTATQYLSYALHGKAYMGVGRNLAYRRQVFEKAKGFENHGHISSGDDDLFIASVTNSENTAICISKQSHTVSQVKDTWKDWFRQKRRHISTAASYKSDTQIILSIFSGTHIMGLLCFFLLLVLGQMHQSVLILMLLRWLCMLAVLFPITGKLEERDLLILLPVLDILFMLYLLFMSPFLITQRDKGW